MINDKKIEDAAKQHSEESYILDYFQACYKDAFMERTKWATNKFLKDLWHPASEELYNYPFYERECKECRHWDEGKIECEIAILQDRKT